MIYRDDVLVRGPMCLGSDHSSVWRAISAMRRLEGAIRRHRSLKVRRQTDGRGRSSNLPSTSIMAHFIRSGRPRGRVPVFFRSRPVAPLVMTPGIIIARSAPVDLEGYKPETGAGVGLGA